MKVRLERINSTHQNLRTNEVEGECAQLPAPGQRFMMSAEGLEYGVRHIETSPVETVEDDGVFKTANSTYRITVIDLA